MKLLKINKLMFHSTRFDRKSLQDEEDLCCIYELFLNECKIEVDSHTLFLLMKFVEVVWIDLDTWTALTI